MKTQYSETFYIQCPGDSSVGLPGWQNKVEINVEELPYDRAEFESNLKEWLADHFEATLRPQVETRTERDAREAAEDEQWEAERAAEMIIGVRF
jgi:hypothetical protein